MNSRRTRNVEQDLHQPDFPRLTLFVRSSFRFFGIFDFKFGFVVGTPSMWTTAAFTHKICGNRSTIVFHRESDRRGRRWKRAPICSKICKRYSLYTQDCVTEFLPKRAKLDDT
jgi:hypothetical protein